MLELVIVCRLLLWLRTPPMLPDPKGPMSPHTAMNHPSYRHRGCRRRGCGAAEDGNFVGAGRVPSFTVSCNRCVTAETSKCFCFLYGGPRGVKVGGGGGTNRELNLAPP